MIKQGLRGLFALIFIVGSLLTWAHEEGRQDDHQEGQDANVQETALENTLDSRTLRPTLAVVL